MRILKHPGLPLRLSLALCLTLCLAPTLAAVIPRAASAQNELLLLRIRQTPKEGLDPLINELSFGHAARIPHDVARLLGDPDPATRVKAAYLLGFLDRTPAVAKTIASHTADPDWEVRREALFALRRHGGPSSVKAAALGLKDPRRLVRLEAARTVGALGGKKAGAALRSALSGVGDDRELELRILEALGDTRDRASAPALRARLESKSEAVRLTALRGLALLGDRSARKKLLQGLRAQERYQRMDAAALLGKVSAPWAKKALGQAFAREADARTRLGLAEALGAQGDDLGLLHLLKVLDDDADGLALPAADALARLKISSKKREALRKRLSTDGAGGPPVRPAATEADLLPDQGLSSLIHTLREKPRTFIERLDAFSAHLKGVPYLDSPLGEGAGVDPDPLLRYDAVDCLTYVEQVLALANASQDDPLPVLLDLRYARGLPSFGERNHLMMAEWIPRNLEKGYLADITREIGGEVVIAVEKRLEARTWRARRGVDLPLDESEVPLGRFTLPVIPVGAFAPFIERVPDGTLLLVVRHDIPARPYRVTHLGFVIRRGAVTYLRHAAKAGYGKVIDERLDTFVRRNAKYRKWPVEGFSLLAPRANPSRVTTLEAAVKSDTG